MRCLHPFRLARRIQKYMYLLMRMTLLKPQSIQWEISKKQLLELSKKDMTAQAINIKYNELDKFLLTEMRHAEGKVSEHNDSATV